HPGGINHVAPLSVAAFWSGGGRLRRRVPADAGRAGARAGGAGAGGGAGGSRGRRCAVQRLQRHLRGRARRPRRGVRRGARRLPETDPIDVREPPAFRAAEVERGVGFSGHGELFQILEGLRAPEQRAATAARGRNAGTDSEWPTRYRVGGRSGLRILGVDPGLALTGYGVIEGSARPTALRFGEVRTSPHTPEAERLHRIHEEISAIIRAFRPDV